MKYAVQIETYNRKSIEARDPDQAVALYHSDLVNHWPKMIPSETVVFTKNEKKVYGPQDVINAVGTEFGLKPYDYLNLI